jgi:multiple sugar transport system substrate-binding protein
MRSVADRVRGTRAPALVVAVLLAVAGCSVARTTAASDEIVVMSGRDDSRGHRRLELIEKWGAETHHAVRLVELSGSADQQHNEMLKEAQAPDSVVDVFNLDVTWTAEFADAGYVRPVDVPDGADFLPGPLATGRYRGVQYALPFNTDAGMLFTNGDLGLGCPESWDAIRDDLGPVAGRPPPRRPEAVWAGQLREYDGLVVNVLEALYGQNPDRRDLFAAGQPALQRAVDTLRPAPEGAPSTVLRDSLTFDEQASIEALHQGRVAMLRGWPVAYGPLTAPSGDRSTPPRIEVCRLPGGGSVLGGQNLAISGRSAHVGEAAGLVRDLTSCASQQLLFDGGGLAPTRACAYAGSTRPDTAFTGQLEEAVRGATPRPQGPCYGRFSAEFSREVHASLQSAGTPLREGLVDDLRRALDCKPLR